MIPFIYDLVPQHVNVYDFVDWVEERISIMMIDGELPLEKAEIKAIDLALEYFSQEEKK